MSLSAMPSHLPFPKSVRDVPPVLEPLLGQAEAVRDAVAAGHKWAPFGSLHNTRYARFY